MLARARSLTSLFAVLLVANCDDAVPPTTEAAACVTLLPAHLETPGSAPAVHVEGDGPAADLLRAELSIHLSRMWGADIVAQPGPPSGGLALHLVAGDDARAHAVDVPERGYILRREGDVVRVLAPDLAHLAYGAYALLERMGARFFHPMQDLVPSYGRPVVPRTLNDVITTPFATRGLHVHTLHPLEYNRALLEPGERNLADAKRLIDWLVKTGQNHLQFFLMSTNDFDAWIPHAEAIVDYAHLRGVTVGIIVNLFAESVLQNQWTLVDDTDNGLLQIETGVDQVMAVQWDLLELALGEFFAADPTSLVLWLNHATAYVSENYPDTLVGVENHVGDYPELWVEYEGQTEYFYFLPGKADPRLMNTVHTVFFFDLYRDWAMYEHENFHGHREFILAELPERRVRYFPESAYWVSADIDVPVYLAEFINARFIDINGLHKEITERGLPPLDGHVLYSSGHEWSYWTIDYLTSWLLWHPDVERSAALSHLAGGFSGCAEEVDAALTGFIDLQTEYLFQKRLVPYASGDDLHDDLGYSANIDTHPPRVPFEALLDMSEAERAALKSTVVDELATAAARMDALLPTLRGACASADETLAAWCAELLDSIDVTRLKLLHSSLLYHALLTAIAGGDETALLGRASATREQAGVIIRRRADAYRFPKEELIEAWDNPTRYPFGYLKQAHTQCLWLRQEDQIAALLDTGTPASPFELRTCQN